MAPRARPPGEPPAPPRELGPAGGPAPGGSRLDADTHAHAEPAQTQLGSPDVSSHADPALHDLPQLAHESFSHGPEPTLAKPGEQAQT